MIECLRNNDFSFGGENSGHLIFAAHSTTGDGILSALQVLRMMREADSDLASMAAVMDEYPSELCNMEVQAKPPLESLGKLKAAMQEADETFGGQGRHLIRYSGTEKKIRVLVEHREAGVCREWVDRFRRVVEEEIG